MDRPPVNTHHSYQTRKMRTSTKRIRINVGFENDYFILIFIADRHWLYTEWLVTFLVQIIIRFVNKEVPLLFSVHLKPQNSYASYILHLLFLK